MSYAERCRDAISALATPPIPEDGEPAESIESAEARLGIRLPAALRDYYLIAGRFDPLNQAHNRLLPPGDWFVDAGRLVFLEENQVVVFWGVDADGDDPTVWQGINREDRPIEWHFVGKAGDLEAFGGDGRAACIVGDDDSSQLYVGGRTEEDFVAIEAELEGFGVGLDRV